MNARRRLATLTAALLVASAFGVASADADIPTPVGWPATSTMRPSLDGWPNAVRISGANRFQTGLAAALTLRGAGVAASYPFGSPDPATADGWFGLGSCPRSVIVVAGDNPADALAASSLSDATGNSTEPYLRISAAADQVFDPVGDFRRVDTDFAPILTTTSTRQGATALNIATRLAAQDLRSGGCTTAREAIIVGGASAVPVSVETELVSIGFERVYRVAGASRYETARLVAESLGTADAPGSPTPTMCTDTRVDDGAARMSFYANSVVEYRASASECVLLNRTVVLADGVNGADALAAGWWTSFWQVPMLLHDGSGTLPTATLEALQTLEVENLIILGGTSRISENVVDQALDAAGRPNVIRISGANRYETSVRMAERLGGWHVTGRGVEFSGSKLCVAASSGPTVGWPDALSAGPWCARYGASARNAPVRALTPTIGVLPTTSAVASLARPAHDAVPVILVPATASELPSSVQSLVTGAFASSSEWCSSATASPGCLAPGFAVVFGGPSVVPDALVTGISAALAGGAATADRSPALEDAFMTQLDLGPVFAVGAGAGPLRVCAPRGAITGARWLVASASMVSSLDVMTTGRYVADIDGVIRSPGSASPACVPVALGSASQVDVWAAGLAGQVSASRSFSPVSTRWLSLDSAVVGLSPSATGGVDSVLDSGGAGSTNWTFVSNPASVSASFGGIAASVGSASVSIALVRGLNTAAATAPDTFTATFTLATSSGAVSGSVVGEAILVAGVWHLRGSNTVSGGWVGRGGWVAGISVAGPGLADDSASWRLDALEPVTQN